MLYSYRLSAVRAVHSEVLILLSLSLSLSLFLCLPLLTQERLARFVSLIPYLPDTRAFMGVCDIWASSEVSTQWVVVCVPLSVRTPLPLSCGV